MATGLQWIREDAPRWDADKQRMFGPAELAATAVTPAEPDAPVADEWWHVTDTAGRPWATAGSTPSGVTRR